MAAPVQMAMAVAEAWESDQPGLHVAWWVLGQVLCEVPYCRADHEMVGLRDALPKAAKSMPIRQALMADAAIEAWLNVYPGNFSRVILLDSGTLCITGTMLTQTHGSATRNTITAVTHNQ